MREYSIFGSSRSVLPKLARLPLSVNAISRLSLLLSITNFTDSDNLIVMKITFKVVFLCAIVLITATTTTAAAETLRPYFAKRCNPDKDKACIWLGTPDDPYQHGPYSEIETREGNSVKGYFYAKSTDFQNYLINIIENRRFGPYRWIGPMREEGYAAVEISEDVYRFMDTEGNLHFGPYKDVRGGFSEGYKVVRATNNRNTFHFIDTTGSLRFGPYRDALDFKEGYAPVKVAHNAYYLIDTTGTQRFGPYRETWGFSEGYANIKLDDGLWYFIDTTGTVRFGPYESAFYFKNGYATVQLVDDPGHYILDTQGTLLGPYYRFRGLTFNDGYIPIRITDDETDEDDELWQFIDTTGTPHFGPFKYVEPFREGYALVQLEDDRWQFIDTNGVLQFEPYLAAYSFRNGYAMVQRSDELIYFIDTTGRLHLGPFQNTGGVIDGYALVELVKRNSFWRRLFRKDKEPVMRFVNITEGTMD